MGKQEKERLNREKIHNVSFIYLKSFSQNNLYLDLNLMFL